MAQTDEKLCLICGSKLLEIDDNLYACTACKVEYTGEELEQHDPIDALNKRKDEHGNDLYPETIL